MLRLGVISNVVRIFFDQIPRLRLEMTRGGSEVDRGETL